MDPYDLFKIVWRRRPIWDEREAQPLAERLARISPERMTSQMRRPPGKPPYALHAKTYRGATPRLVWVTKPAPKVPIEAVHETRVLPLFLSRFLVLKGDGRNPKTQYRHSGNPPWRVSNLPRKTLINFPMILPESGVPYNGRDPFPQETRCVPTRNAAQRKKELPMTTCPHCMGAGCLHCRERHLEQSRLVRRSLLTDDDRRALCIFTKPLILASQSKPCASARSAMPAALRFNSVLPANYHL